MCAGQIRGYETLSEIGLGSTSRVFLAYDSQKNRQVAIKMLSSENLNDLGYRSRFEQEANLIAALQHEAIVSVYEYGVENGIPYIVMQYMPGGSLAARLEQGPLSPDQSIKALSRIASALDYAHRQGIIHRDLKASNILFDRSDNAYLADFGIALHPESTWQRSQASGTPTYMSPEQALGEQAIDSRSDIYSLGVIAFEMLAGQLPFSGELPIAVLLQHIHDSPPSLSTIRPGLPPTVDLALQRALAKSPQDRFAAAADFALAFQQALSAPWAESIEIEHPGQDVLAQGSDQSLESLLELPEGKSSTGAAHPETRLRKPVFPQLVFPPEKSPVRLRSNLRLAQNVLVLGLVAWLAVMFAALTTMVARSQALFPSSNIQAFYDDSAFALVNVSGKPLDLSNVVFQRLSAQGAVAASFSAKQWGQVNARLPAALPEGDCLQLLRPGNNTFLLSPGKAPAKPSSCNVSQGWLVANDPAWQFWVIASDSSDFRVVQNGKIVGTCRIASGKCGFFLPGR